ncbi:helix-turn-helix transcriptional regulator [Qiania dongpingensis]|uniref:Helix-turn-helix transcriptional regulator n=1 Tax=Qiania dongpingensis TaxID=2763669 RepID=A0A7G9G5J6_9FIRM|nr:helix-turn-helix transcriptional regulator [Qiania dongpingensis]
MKNKLQQLRWDSNLSQQQLAIKSGVKRSIISNIENGHTTNPSIVTALKLAKALNVTIEDIFALD